MLFGFRGRIPQPAYSMGCMVGVEDRVFDLGFKCV